MAEQFRDPPLPEAALRYLGSKGLKPSGYWTGRLARGSTPSASSPRAWGRDDLLVIPQVELLVGERGRGRRGHPPAHHRDDVDRRRHHVHPRQLPVEVVQPEPDRGGVLRGRALRARLQHHESHCTNPDQAGGPHRHRRVHLPVRARPGPGPARRAAAALGRTHLPCR